MLLTTAIQALSHYPKKFQKKVSKMKLFETNLEIRMQACAEIGIFTLC